MRVNQYALNKLQSYYIMVYKWYQLLSDIFQLLCFRELIEHIALPKSQRKLDAPDTTDLMNLLIEKDNELKDLIKIGKNMAAS